MLSTYPQSYPQFLKTAFCGLVFALALFAVSPMKAQAFVLAEQTDFSQYLSGQGDGTGGNTFNPEGISQTIDTGAGGTIYYITVYLGPDTDTTDDVRFMMLWNSATGCGGEHTNTSGVVHETWGSRPYQIPISYTGYYTFYFPEGITVDPSVSCSFSLGFSPADSGAGYWNNSASNATRKTRYFGTTSGTDNVSGGTMWPNDLHNLYYSITSTDPAVAEDTSTHFTELIPFATTTATTTTVGFEAYINPDDYVSGMTVHVDFYNPVVSSVSASVLDACNIFGAGKCSLDFPITASTTVASTTEITFNYGGTTKATWTIRKPSFYSSLWFVGGLFAPDVLATAKTSFVVGFQTLFDQSLNGDGTVVNGDASGVVGYFLTGGIASTTPANRACANFLQGSTTECLISLVIPSGEELSVAFNSLYTGLLSRFPLGYATRFLTIMSGNGGAVEPPALSYTFGSSSPPVLQGRTYTVQIWDNFGSTSPIVLARADDGSNKNIWDIVMPWWNIVIALAVLLAMLTDLFGFEMGTDKTQAGRRYGALTSREKGLANRAQNQNKYGQSGMGRIK